MSSPQRRTRRDVRRQTWGQNFLVDPAAIEGLVEEVGVEPDQFIVELGAGTGALTIPLARRGAQIVAVEKDSRWAGQLADTLVQEGLTDRVSVYKADLRTLTLPRMRYRVVSNLPFGLTTAVMALLLDRPEKGPWRADLLIQSEVARKRAETEPANLRTAAWAPWWTFQLGPRVPRSAFRPIPSVDAALLKVRRRDPPVLPARIAPRMRELLRPAWNPHVSRESSTSENREAERP